VHVVEHEDSRLVSQPAEHGVDHDQKIGFGFAEELHNFKPPIALRGAQRGTHMAPEHDRVPVELVATDPRGTRTPLTHPRREHDTLARARRCHDSGQRPVRTTVQDVEQPRASDVERR
jgi:hypothetical protein